MTELCSNCKYNKKCPFTMTRITMTKEGIEFIKDTVGLNENDLSRMVAEEFDKNKLSFIHKHFVPLFKKVMCKGGNAK